MKSTRITLLLVALLVAVFVANAWSQSGKGGDRSTAVQKTKSRR
jgi:hypothetical protein